jgi:membrane-associated PAP2 superfamily phosphatase
MGGSRNRDGTRTERGGLRNARGRIERKNMELDALLAFMGNILIAFDGSLAVTMGAGSLTGDVWTLWLCWLMDLVCKQ